MSERNPQRFENGSNAQDRSPEEQRRLMEEYDQARYEEAFPADEEAAFNDRMAERERQDEYNANLVIEERVMENSEARRMYMIAQQVAELKANGGEPAIIADKEDKLQELLLAYTEKAHADRDLEYRNAEMERDTVKGRDIRANKELAAEAELAKRLEEADFIVNSTDQTWVNEKSSPHASSESTPSEPAADDPEKNYVKNIEEARVLADIEEISRLIQADPEAAKKAGAYDKLRDLMRQIDEILAKVKSDDEIGEPKDADVKDNDDIGEPKDVNTDDIGEPKDADVKDGDDIGEPKDVNLDDKDKDDIGEPKDVVLVDDEGMPDDEHEPGRRPNPLRRAYDRVYVFFALHNGPAGALAYGLERFRDSRKAKVVAAIGALGLIGLGVAGRHYGWFDGVHHSGGTGVNPSDTQGGATGGSSSQAPGEFTLTPPATPEVSIPGGSGFAHPWNWMRAAMDNGSVTPPKGMGPEQALHYYGDMAAKNGHSVEWYNLPNGLEAVRVDGSDDTTKVAEVLSQFAK